MFSGSIFLASTIAAASLFLFYLHSPTSLTDLFSWPLNPPTIIIMGTTNSSTTSSRTPVYFLGIGGPNFMENREHPAFKKLGETGREITSQVQPKAVVVISAHWQDDGGAPNNRVSINYAADTDIIYDFYGFPPHYYQYKYPNKGSPEVAQRVVDKLTGAGIEVQKVKRGLDHGVWVGFIAGKQQYESIFFVWLIVC